jgi:hypothetical protein
MHFSTMDTDIIDRDIIPSGNQLSSSTETLLRYALFSRLAYFDFDVTTDDLCVVGQYGCIHQVKFIDKADTQLWIFEDRVRDELVIAFRGSDSMGDILTNFCIIPDSFLFPDHGTCHGGHMKCYKTVRNDIMTHVQHYIKQGGKKVVVCGHSLGGTCATICALDIALSSTLDVSCYSYGALAFADRTFCNSLKYHVPESYRIIHDRDFAPFIPMLFYKHYDDTQTCISISTSSFTPNDELHHHDVASPLQSLHSKAMHYIRHHSIESYIAGLRKLSKANLLHHVTPTPQSHSKPNHKPQPYKNLTPITLSRLSSRARASIKNGASIKNVFPRLAH